MKTRLRQALLFGALLSLIASGRLWAAQPPTADLRAGPVAMRYETPQGISIWYRNIPVTVKSTLYVVTPGWTQLLLGLDRAAPAVRTWEEGEARLAEVQLQNDAVVATYRLRVTPDSASIALEYGLKASNPAQLEYNLGYFHGPLLAGAAFHAETGTGPVDGRVSYVAASPERDASRLATDIRRIRLDTRAACIDLECDGGGLVIFDARRSRQGWAQTSPVFWAGVERRLAGGARGQIAAALHFAPPAAPPSRLPSETETSPRPALQPLRTAMAPPRGASVVIPEPQQFLRLPADLRLSSSSRFVIACRDTRVASAAREVTSEWRQRAGVSLKVTRAGSLPRRGPADLWIGTSGDPRAEELAKEAGLAVPSAPEGYGLVVTAHGALVVGRTDAGAFYGLQTMRQLQSGQGPATMLQGCRVADWPMFSFRGAHLFPSAKGIGFQKKLISQVLAYYKLNHLVLESELAQWASHPEIGSSEGATPQQLREEVAFARAHFMEVTPLINSLGHCEWMFRNEQNRSLAEDAARPFAYCPSNEESYRFLFSIYDEALEVFDYPRRFHIGHDEVRMTARFPNDDCCRQVPFPELFARDVARLQAYLKNRGADTMLWGDMLLDRSEAPDATNAASLAEARRTREALPVDLNVADWHYSDAEREPSVSVLARPDRSVIGASWYVPANIQKFSLDALRQGAVGMLQTTWAGYFPDESVLTTERRQFSAMVLAGDYFWKPRAVAAPELPYSADEEFARRWETGRPVSRPSAGWAIDLGLWANLPLADTPDRPGWLEYGEDHDLSALSLGPTELGGYRFEIKPLGVALASPLLPQRALPDLIRVPLQDLEGHGLSGIREIAFLTCTGWPTHRGQEVARLRFQYESGQVETMPLRYGDEIAAWSDPVSPSRAQTVWRGRTRGGEQCYLRLVRWSNPQPSDRLVTLEIAGSGSETLPVVVSATAVGVEAPEASPVRSPVRSR